MWFERFDIIAIVLSKGHLPSTWWRFEPTFVDVGIFHWNYWIFLCVILTIRKNISSDCASRSKNYLKIFG